MGPRTLRRLARSFLAECCSVAPARGPLTHLYPKRLRASGHQGRWRSPELDTSNASHWSLFPPSRGFQGAGRLPHTAIPLVAWLPRSQRHNRGYIARAPDSRGRRSSRFVGIVPTPFVGGPSRRGREHRQIRNLRGHQPKGSPPSAAMAFCRPWPCRTSPPIRPDFAPLASRHRGADPPPQSMPQGYPPHSSGGKPRRDSL